METNEDRTSPDVSASSDFWLLTADRRDARLLTAAYTPHGRLHVEQRVMLTEEWRELQHDRPSPRSGKDGHSYASLGHEEEERTHRFAKKVVEWLEGQMDERRITRLHAFCARRFLGQLRVVLPDRLHERLIDHSLDLASLTPGELAVHEAVTGLVSGDAEGSQEAHSSTEGRP